MLCYMDMTFCQFYKDCLEGETCPRALTSEVERAAERWWQAPGPPICMFAAKPKCWVKGDQS